MENQLRSQQPTDLLLNFPFHPHFAPDVPISISAAAAINLKKRIYDLRGRKVL